MDSVPATFNEQNRLAELHQLKLLDGSGDGRIDQLARLAADVLEVPVALVTLVDSQRQWFLANCGLQGIDGTDRDSAFCARTLHYDALMVVDDAALDPRFSNNPLVTGTPYIRFYAGAVLRGANGQPLGSLCAIDYTPRAFSEDDRR